MKFYKKLYLSFMLFFCFTFVEGKAFAYIENLRGDVEIISSKSERIVLSGIVGREINSGDIVKVYDNSFCDISSEDDRTFLRIDKQSEVKFTVTDKTREIALRSGSAYVHHTNNNAKKKAFVFSNHSQIYLTNSQIWLTLEDKKIDKIYTFGDELNISDKFKGIRKKTNKTNMIYSSGDDIKFLEDNVDFKNIVPEYIFNEFSKKEYALNDSLLFNLQEADLIPRYYANINTDNLNNLESNNSNFGVSLMSGASYYYDGNYANIAVESYFSRGNFEMMLKLDEYIPIGDPLLTINDWLDVGMLISKVHYLSLFNNEKTIFLNAGKLKNLTFGHGQLLHNYSNSYNYPIMQRSGVFIHYSPMNKQSYLLDFFISDISQVLNGGGFIGFHGSLFLSNFFPLTVGYGYLMDLDQYSEHNFNISSNSKIKATELDFEYTVSENRDWRISLLSELDAIFFPYQLSYLRNDNNLDGALKTRKGTWGSMFGAKVVFETGHKFSLGIHYNDALYTPYYFSSTYDFEKVRVLSFDPTNPQNSTHETNQDFLDGFCDDADDSGGCNEGEFLYLSKELYPLFSTGDFVYSMIGTSVQYDYNYYNLRGVSFSGMYLYDNNEDSNNSYYLLGFEVFSSGDFLFDRLNNFKFYFHRNFASISDDENLKENIMLGTQLDFKITKLLSLYFDWQNVYYDMDSNAEVDKINSYTLQFKYSLKK